MFGWEVFCFVFLATFIPNWLLTFFVSGASRLQLFQTELTCQTNTIRVKIKLICRKLGSATTNLVHAALQCRNVNSSEFVELAAPQNKWAYKNDAKHRENLAIFRQKAWSAQKENLKYTTTTTIKQQQTQAAAANIYLLSKLGSMRLGKLDAPLGSRRLLL